MKLIFLGTGHWSSSTRRHTCLYCQIDGTNILFDCPAHAPESIAAANLPLPDAIFITHKHPDHYNEQAMRQLWHTRQVVNLMRGARINDISIRSQIVKHGLERTVGYNVYLGESKLLAFVPDFEQASNDLFSGAACAIVDAACSSALCYPHQSIQATGKAIRALGVPTILATHIADEYEQLPEWIKIPNDMETIIVETELNERTTYSAIILDQLTIDRIAAGTITRLIFPRPVPDTHRKAIVVDRAGVVHASIEIDPGEEINIGEFRIMTDMHGMTDTQRVNRWPGLGKLYAAEFSLVKTFDSVIVGSVYGGTYSTLELQCALEDPFTSADDITEDAATEDSNELQEASTIKAQALRFMRELDALLKNKKLPTVLRDKLNAARRELRRTWRDLATDADNENTPDE